MRLPRASILCLSLLTACLQGHALQDLEVAKAKQSPELDALLGNFAPDVLAARQEAERQAAAREAARQAAAAEAARVAAQTKPFRDAAKAVSDAVDARTKPLRDVASAAGNAASKAGKAVNDAASRAGKAVNDAADRAGKAVSDAADRATKPVRDAANQVATAVSDAADVATKPIRDGASAAGKAVSDAASAASTAVAEAASAVAEAASAEATRVANNIARDAADLAEAAKPMTDAAAYAGSWTANRTRPLRNYVAARVTPVADYVYRNSGAKTFVDYVADRVKKLTGYDLDNSTNVTAPTPAPDSSILGNYTNETHFHHYSTLEWQLDKAIKELEVVVKEYTKARQKIAKGDPSVMNKLVSTAKGQMTAWWEAASRAEEEEKKMRRSLAEAEIRGKEDALMAKFRLKQPSELTGQIAKDFNFKYDDGGFKGLKDAIEFFWTQMSEFQMEDKVLIKTWIYAQQQLYLSAFRQIFKSTITGSRGQIRNGLEIPWLVWVLGNVTEIAAKEMGADSKELFYEVDPPLIQHVRDLANEDPLKMGLKEWLYKTLTAIVKKPLRRTAVENNIMKYVRPSEKRLLKQQGVRPEVVNLKAGLELGEAAKKEFDKTITVPLTELLNEMREKGARSREKKLEAVITELEMGRYITAFRILMKNEAGDGLYPRTIKRAMDIAKGVAGLKLGNSGLAKEVAVMFDRIAPRGRNQGERFKKIRKWANTRDLQTVDFAQKVFEECFPTEHYNLFVNVFLDRMSKDMREYSEPSAYGKIKTETK